MMPSRPARTAVPRVDSVSLALLSTFRRRARGDRLCRVSVPGEPPLRPGRLACGSTGNASPPRIGTCLSAMAVPRGFDPTLILVLNLAGTFVFGLSGGLAAVHARLDLFGVV